jgi:GAF domain-containing protein
VTTVRVAEILSLVLEGGPASTDVPHRLVMAATEALPVTGVGLVLMTDAGPAGTVAISDGPAATMEELQFILGEGPCVDASTTGRPVLQPDLGSTGPGRWPAFTAGALEAGIRAVFALPLRMGGIRLGVMDLYRDHAGELSAGELAEALSFADAATTLLLQLQAEATVDGSGVATIEVIEDRAEVHQATGMVSVQLGCGMTEALVRLRARAYASERPILDLSRDVLDGAVRLDRTYDDGDDDTGGSSVDGP